MEENGVHEELNEPLDDFVRNLDPVELNQDGGDESNDQQQQLNGKKTKKETEEELKLLEEKRSQVKSAILTMGVDATTVLDSEAAKMLIEVDKLPLEQVINLEMVLAAKLNEQYDNIFSNNVQGLLGDLGSLISKNPLVKENMKNDMVLSNAITLYLNKYLVKFPPALKILFISSQHVINGYLTKNQYLSELDKDKDGTGKNTTDDSSKMSAIASISAINNREE